MNADTLSLPHCDSGETIQENLDITIGKDHYLPKGFFPFRLIQFFYDRVKDTKGNAWSSYVVDTKSGKIFFFDKNPAIAKKILHILIKKMDE